MLSKLSLNSTGNTYKWAVTLSTGFFMFVVLYVYRAYHIDQVPAFTGHSMFFRALTHSVIISLVFYILEFHISQRLPVNQKIKPFVTALIATFTGLNITFLTFNYFYHWTELHWLSYSQFLYEYPLILAFPVALSLMVDRLSSHSESKSGNLIVIASENQKERFQLKAENLLFIKSADNYVEIYYLSMQQVRKYLLRKSLKDIDEEHTANSSLIRCHRSYIVNPDNIDHVNRVNNKVELSISGILIPVSKKHLNPLIETFPELFTPHMEFSSQIT